MAEMNIEQVLTDTAASLKVIQDALKANAEKAEREIRTFGDLQAETKATADKLIRDFGVMNQKFTHLEQRQIEMADGRGPMRRMTTGQEFIENEEVKKFCASRPNKGSLRIEVKNAITSLTTDADGSAGDLVNQDRQAGVVASPQRLMTIRGLLTPGQTVSNTIEYVKETGFTNAAASVTEGAAKPESTMKFDLFTATVRTIAHYVQASVQILDDAAQLRSYIDGRLRYGLALVEENQLLLGPGTGIQLEGLVPAATAFSAAFETELPTRIDTIRLGILQASLAEYPPSFIVLHPTDWARIETAKDTLGRYIIGDPGTLKPPSLWGLPIVATQAMTITEFLVGTSMAAQVFDRQQPTVEISTEHNVNFTTNMVTIRAEERLTLAIYRPEAFITGSLGSAT